jgi:chromosome segregation ATPase
VTDAGIPAERDRRWWPDSADERAKMNTADSNAELQEELRLVDEDLEQLRKSNRELHERIGDRDEEPTDAEERSAMIFMAEEQDSLISDLEGRREQLVQRLGARRGQL